MLQVPNIIRKPQIWIPPTLASAILGPLSTTILKMESNPIERGNQWFGRSVRCLGNHGRNYPHLDIVNRDPYDALYPSRPSHPVDFRIYEKEGLVKVRGYGTTTVTFSYNS